MRLRPGAISAASGPADSIRGGAIFMAVTSGRGLILERALGFRLAMGTERPVAADMWMVLGDFFRRLVFRLNPFDAHAAIDGGHMDQRPTAA